MFIGEGLYRGDMIRIDMKLKYAPRELGDEVALVATVAICSQGYGVCPRDGSRRSPDVRADRSRNESAKRGSSAGQPVEQDSNPSAG